jgi:hypothetical protein
VLLIVIVGLTTPVFLTSPNVGAGTETGGLAQFPGKIGSLASRRCTTP